MRRPRNAWLFAPAVSLMLGGCVAQQSARYIYQDGEFGVIGIPQNSPYGHRDYMKQAEALMARHFPQGYEIVRAEEVVEGQRVLDLSHSAQFETDPAIDALNQRINIGKVAQTTSAQQKDSLPILESRIIYKRRSPTAPYGNNGFAAVSSLAPEQYLDPNELARAREKSELLTLKSGKGAAVADKGEKTKDGETKQAAAATPSKQSE